MSVRRKPSKESPTALDPSVLRSELDDLREVYRNGNAAGVAANANASVGVVSEASREFDKLSPTEQQAASLGAHPEAFKPLKDLNEAHFEVLRKANALSSDLESKILAFKQVAESSAA